MTPHSTTRAFGAHHPGTGDLGDLPGHRAGGPGRRRHHHRLALLRAADVGHPEISGGTGRPVDAHDRQLIGLTRDRRAEDVVANNRVVLKASKGGNDVADGESLTPRFDDFADPGGADDLAQLDGWQIARLVVEPGANRGVQTHISGAQQRFTVAELGRGGRDQLSVGGLHQSRGALAEQDLAVRQRGHGE
jgi:hypothetical protein